MRVLVTGGTGFLGCHMVAALVEAGHDVRLLVRSLERIPPALDPLGVAAEDVEVGDVTDAASVERALAGCEAVFHAAEVYTVDPRRHGEMRRTNVRGTELVLGTAHRLGLDPIVHVSSFVALLPRTGPALTPDEPLKEQRYAYPRMKTTSERIARELQAQGAPVVIVRPGSVWGPHDPHFGETHEGVGQLLTGQVPVWARGGVPIDDVRDLARANAAVFRAGVGPRSYLFGAHYVEWPDLLELLADVAGRPVRTRLISPRVMMGITRVGDAVRRLVPHPVYGSDAAYATACEARCDDSRARQELGYAPRDLRETVADTVRSLVDAGRVPAAAVTGSSVTR